MGHRPLVEHAACKVHHQRNPQYQRENAPGSHTSRLVWVRAQTSVLRAHLEEVGALVRVGAYEVHRGAYVGGVAIAEEGNRGGLAARCILAGVADRDRLPLVIVVLVSIGGSGVGGAAGGCAAGGTVGVLQDELLAPRV